MLLLDFQFNPRHVYSAVNSIACSESIACRDYDTSVGYNGLFVYSEVSPIVFNGAYSQVSMLSTQNKSWLSLGLRGNSTADIPSHPLHTCQGRREALRDTLRLLKLVGLAFEEACIITPTL